MKRPRWAKTSIRFRSFPIIVSSWGSLAKCGSCPRRENTSSDCCRGVKIPSPDFAAVSPDGKTCALHFGDTIHLVDVGTKQAVRTLKTQPDASSNNLIFSPSGRLLAGCFQNRIRIWEVATGKEVTPGGIPPGWITGMGFHHDGRTLYAGTKDGIWTTWDLITSPPRPA